MKKSEWCGFFDLILVLNLESRVDRRNEIADELLKNNIKLGVDAHIFKAVRPDAAGDFPSVGARGCFESHLLMLKQARDKGVQHLLIVEDDLSIDKSWSSCASDLINKIQDIDWDIIYFGYELLHDLEKSSAVDNIVIKKWDYPVRTTHFYAVHNKIFDRLIEFLEILLSRPAGDPQGGPMHVDGALTTFRKQNPDVVTYLVDPCMGFQRPSKTDIGEPHFLDRYKLLAPVVSKLRKIKKKIME
jgi:glycosyl transferase family 25